MKLVTSRTTICIDSNPCVCNTTIPYCAYKYCVIDIINDKCYADVCNHYVQYMRAVVRLLI